MSNKSEVSAILWQRLSTAWAPLSLLPTTPQKGCCLRCGESWCKEKEGAWAAVLAGTGLSASVKKLLESVAVNSGASGRPSLVLQGGWPFVKDK